jgi:cell wall-associated NlpC family hydrolase
MKVARLMGSAWLVACVGCGGVTDATVGGALLEGADESLATSTGELAQWLPEGTTLRSTTGVNLRKGPSTSYGIIAVVPKGAVVTTAKAGAPSNGFYQVRFGALVGWTHGAYYKREAQAAPAPVAAASAREAAIERARSGLGFSYWWGHGKWQPSGATASNAGSCAGNCPDCTHAGSNGADCSGYAAKVWQVPAGNVDPAVDAHPYSTLNFVSPSSQWQEIPWEQLQVADALVYRKDGAGHMFIYESQDSWGWMWAYEARGCSYGIVHNLRSVASVYKAIIRSDW